MEQQNEMVERTEGAIIDRTRKGVPRSRQGEETALFTNADLVDQVFPT